MGSRPGSGQGARLWVLLALAPVTAGLAVASATALFELIAFFSNLFYYHRLSLRYVEPHLAPGAQHPLTVAILMFGALVGGLGIRYVDLSLRGHGIPETMEAVVQRDSRIRPRVGLFKPVLSALTIGTGSPFGAEGPIIQTAGALGSLLGQVLPVSGTERKILLGCGAAAGMACIFGTPLAGALLALELLVFEFSARALIPIAVAAAVATALRPPVLPPAPLFPAHLPVPLGVTPLLWTAALAVAAGGEAAGITRVLYGLEDAFSRMPRAGLVTRPMLGAAVVGLIALRAPSVLGMGYDLIRGVLAGTLTTRALATAVAAKAAGWLIALASGTVGGVLAPLFLIAGGSGELLGRLLHGVTGLDPALVGLIFMAAVFAGGSRAMLTAVVFALEVTGDYGALVPVTLAVVIATAVAQALLPYNIMTGKLERRGLRLSLDFMAAAPRERAVGAARGVGEGMGGDASRLRRLRARATGRRRVRRPLRPRAGLPYAEHARFRFALRRFLHFSEERARAAGLTPAQHQLLLAIRGSRRGWLSVGAVARALIIRPHSAAGLVERAVRDGLLVKESDPDDHRRVRLKLTPRGEALIAELTLAHRPELLRLWRRVPRLR